MQIQGPWRRKTQGQIYNRIQQPFKDGFNHQGPKRGVSTLVGSRCWLAWIFFAKKNSLGMKGFNRKFLVGFLLHEKCGVERYDTYFLYVCIVCIKCIFTCCFFSSGPLRLTKWNQTSLFDQYCQELIKKQSPFQYTYIYIYMCICICICIYVFNQKNQHLTKLGPIQVTLLKFAVKRMVCGIRQGFFSVVKLGSPTRPFFWVSTFSSNTIFF